MMVFVMSDCIYSNMGGTAVKVDLSSLEFERILGIFLYAQLAERKIVAAQHRSRAEECAMHILYLKLAERKIVASQHRSRAEEMQAFLHQHGFYELIII